MDILTDKAKEDFLNYYWENYIGKTRCVSKKEETEEFFDSIISPLKTALITEWFRENAGYHINVHPFGDKINWCYNITDFKNDPDKEFYQRLSSLKLYERREDEKFISYNDAFISATQKLNEIYNKAY